MNLTTFKSFSPKALALAALSVATLASCTKDDISQNRTETQTHAPTQERATGEYIVVLKNDNEKASNKGLSYGKQLEMVRELANEVLTDNGIENIDLNENSLGTAGTGFTAKLSASQLAILKKDSRIDYIEEDRLVNPAMSDVLSTTISSRQQISWGTAKVGGAGNGTGKTAWIIDSGIDPSHPDLNVDKSRSRSFLSSSQGSDYRSYADKFGHGTNVAGIIGAKSNSYGTVGVAAGANLVALRVMDARGSAYVSKIAAALNWVAYYGKAGDVVNLSIGFGASSTVDRAVKKVAAKGIYVAIAAGNSGKDAAYFSPARVNATNVYTVSSMNNSNQFINGSNFGATTVDFAAPGANIATTAIGGKYALFGGTSSAAPHMAGILLTTGGKPRIIGKVSGDKDSKADPIAAR